MIPRYILISVREREIKEPRYFDTKEVAHEMMCRDVARVLGVSVEEIVESYLSGVEYNDVTCITESTAWTEKYGVNYDWRICRI